MSRPAKQRKIVDESRSASVKYLKGLLKCAVDTDEEAITLFEDNINVDELREWVAAYPSIDVKNPLMCVMTPPSFQDYHGN